MLLPEGCNSHSTVLRLCPSFYLQAHIPRIAAPRHRCRPARLSCIVSFRSEFRSSESSISSCDLSCLPQYYLEHLPASPRLVPNKAATRSSCGWPAVTLWLAAQRTLAYSTPGYAMDGSLAGRISPASSPDALSTPSTQPPSFSYSRPRLPPTD